MKKLLSIRYGEWAFNLSMLCIRLVAGLNMLFLHGIDKLQNFSTLKTNFYSFWGLGPEASLVLAIFAELFCSIFVILGLFTRFATIPLIITLLVAMFGFNAGKPWITNETGSLYLSGYFILLLCRPGKVSVDSMLNK